MRPGRACAAIGPRCRRGAWGAGTMPGTKRRIACAFRGNQPVSGSWPWQLRALGRLFAHNAGNSDRSSNEPGSARHSHPVGGRSRRGEMRNSPRQHLGESPDPPPNSRVNPRIHLKPSEVNPRIHLRRGEVSPRIHLTPGRTGHRQYRRLSDHHGELPHRRLAQDPITLSTSWRCARATARAHAVGRAEGQRQQGPTLWLEHGWSSAAVELAAWWALLLRPLSRFRPRAATMSRSCRSHCDRGRYVVPELLRQQQRRAGVVAQNRDQQQQRDDVAARSRTVRSRTTRPRTLPIRRHRRGGRVRRGWCGSRWCRGPRSGRQRWASRTRRLPVDGLAGPWRWLSPGR
jgi:hypothetical protein